MIKNFYIGKTLGLYQFLLRFSRAYRQFYQCYYRNELSLFCKSWTHKYSTVYCVLYNTWHSHTRVHTRSPAVARMADHTAPVIKLTLTLTLTGHSLAKQVGYLPLNALIMRHNEAYWATFCTLKTTCGFIFLLPVAWSDLATNRKWSLSQ